MTAASFFQRVRGAVFSSVQSTPRSQTVARGDGWKSIQEIPSRPEKIPAPVRSVWRVVYARALQEFHAAEDAFEADPHGLNRDRLAVARLALNDAVVQCKRIGGFRVWTGDAV